MTDPASRAPRDPSAPAVAGSPASPPPGEVDALIRQAESLFQAGHLQEAQALFEVGAQAIPPRSTALLRLATIAIRTDRLDEADRHLARMRHEHPGNQWTPMVEGDAAMERLDFARAAVLYREAVERMPANPAVRSRLDQALSEADRERLWHAPAALELWSGKEASRFLAAPPEERVLIVTWDIGHNVAGRGITLAETICDARPTAMAGPMFPMYGDGLWPPLAEGERQIPIVGWRAPSFRHFLEGALRLLREWPAGTVWVSKPRFPGLLVGILYREILGARVLCDIDDDELAFVNGDRPRDLDEFLSALDPQDWIRPHGRLWTELGLGMLPAMDGITACNPVLAARHGATLVRHGRSMADARAAMARRGATREELGFAPDDKVVLFLGTPRRHKGLLQLAQSVIALGRPEVVLCIAGPVADPEMERELQSMPGLRMQRIPAQPFARVLDLNATADVVVLLQDRATAISQSQTPAKLTDAVAVGTPVLLTDVPPVADVIEAGAAMAIREGDDLTARLSAALDADRQPGRAHPFFAAEMSYEANRERALGALATARESAPKVDRDAPRLLSFLRREMPGILPPDLAALGAPWLGHKAADAPRIDPDRPINVAFFWKQQDSGLYGRRQDMLLRELADRPEIGRILHIDAPMPVKDLQIRTNPMRTAAETERSMVSSSALARLAGLLDEPKIHRRSLIIGSEGDKLMGRQLPGAESFPNAVEAWLDDLDLRDNCIAWVCPVVAGFEDVQRRLRFPFVVCDYIDDQRFWPLSKVRRRQVFENYRFMAETADLAVANCAPVAASLERDGLSPILVPNGIDVRSRMPEPAAEIARLDGPVIGYCGNMDDRFDFDLVETVARQRPHWQIVLIGKLTRRPQAERMRSLSNVHLLGMRPYEQARACIAAFHVAMIPHERTDLSDRMNPLKAYVYRSLGVRVVSTDVANLDDLRDELAIARDAAGFLAAIEAALQRRSVDGRSFPPADLMAGLSWQSRMGAIWAEIDRKLRVRFPRAAS